MWKVQRVHETVDRERTEREVRTLDATPQVHTTIMLTPMQTSKEAYLKLEAQTQTLSDLRAESADAKRLGQELQQVVTCK